MAAMWRQVALVLVVVGMTAFSSSRAYDVRRVKFGRRQSGDRFTAHYTILKNAVRDKVVEVIESFALRSYHRITMIRASDHSRNGIWTKIALINGGPGYPNATLKYKSQKGSPIFVNVMVFAINIKKSKTNLL